MNTPAPSSDQLQDWIASEENEYLEFKEARNQYSSEKLTRYCVALSNEGGGQIILGVTDKRPRRVVGTSAFRDLSKLKRDLGQRIHLRVDVCEIDYEGNRVLIITSPPRPIGMPIQYEGSYWMRRGEELVAMSPDALKAIFDEGQPDYSAELCPGASIDDLDEMAVGRLRELWFAASENQALNEMGTAQLLEDAELTVDGKITYAALILLGSRKGLGRHLAQAETIFEYRSSESDIAHAQRMEFRQGFLGFIDELWKTINLRNEVHLFRDGLFRHEISTFNEGAVREAILNALAHRDYRLGGSIFVRQFPRKLEIISPGGFPLGITLENLLWRQSPRNRRVAEVMAKCNLVERSGQGVNLMVEACVQESKPLPDFSASDDFEVTLVLNGEVQDDRFLVFLEKIGAETLSSFTTEDFLLLNAVQGEGEIGERLRSRLPVLLGLGVIESKGRGRGTKYMLSQRFYNLTGKPGAYSREKGLDTETNKALLRKHIERYKTNGSPLRDLQEVLPAVSSKHIQHLLAGMRNAGEVHLRGKTRGGRWFPGTDPGIQEGDL